MTKDSELLAKLLSKPVAPELPVIKVNPERDFTSRIEISGNTLTAELRAGDGDVNEGTAKRFLEDEGQNPTDWEVTGFRKIEYGAGMESVRFTYKRVGATDVPGVSLAEMPVIKRHKAKANRAEGDKTFIIALGDMQFGKIDGDGVEGTLKRTIDCLDKAADTLAFYRKRFDIGHIHVAWLGDHIEGFVSQGGANVWRTPLGLDDQLTLARRTMIHALTNFADEADRVSMAAVPGNHGEPVRFAGKGTTRYDDSHDTGTLLAVADAAALNPDAFGHVEFYVPSTDELTVSLDLSGTITAHAHGHKWRPGRHMEWWKGQAFNRQSAFHGAQLLLAGHLHHEFVDSDGDRTFVQPPAMESESTWWRHTKGTTGAPGLIVAVTGQGETNLKEVIR